MCNVCPYHTIYITLFSLKSLHLCMMVEEFGACECVCVLFLANSKTYSCEVGKGSKCLETDKP